MKENEFPVPPISSQGAKVPFKELSAERPESSLSAEEKAALDQNKAVKKNKVIIILLAIVLVIVLGLLLTLAIKFYFYQPQEEVKPSPTSRAVASPEATGSGELSKAVLERRNELEKQIREVDLEETDLIFPSIDFDIKF